MLLQLVLNKKNYQIFSIVWVLLIIAVSTIPYLPQPEIILEKGFSLRLDYFFHFGVYFILGFLVTIWQANQSAKISPIKIIFLIIAGILFGFLDEWHQMLIPGRRYNPIDFIYNALGFIAGLIFTYYYLLQFLILKKQKLKSISRKLFRSL